MTSRRKLADLIERGFSDGYDQFKELIDFATKSDPEFLALSLREKAAARLSELLSVAMVEGLNDVEEQFNLDPLAAITVLWEMTGATLALMNAQAFTRASGPVQKEMLASLTDAYRRTLRALIAPALTTQNPTPSKPERTTP